MTNPITAKINYMKMIKITLGSTIAIIAAQTLGLQFPASAGIITLLSIQDTKKDTIVVAGKRAFAFIIALLIAKLAFYLLGYNPYGFGVFLLLFVTACFALTYMDCIAMNAVLVTHFLTEGNMSVPLIQNEAMLMVIGAGIGVLLNLYIPGKEKHIRAEQHSVEEQMKNIIDRMADYIISDKKENYDGSCFEGLYKKIDESVKLAYENRDNTLFGDVDYYIRYLEMRKSQADILKNIYENIVRIDYIPREAHIISTFVKDISNTFHEYNNASDLLIEHNDIMNEMRKRELPVTRIEFENRAKLYQILSDFHQFLMKKKNFADSMSRYEKEKYWM